MDVFPKENQTLVGRVQLKNALRKRDLKVVMNVMIFLANVSTTQSFRCLLEKKLFYALYHIGVNTELRNLFKMKRVVISVPVVGINCSEGQNGATNVKYLLTLINPKLSVLIFNRIISILILNHLVYFFMTIRIKRECCLGIILAIVISLLFSTSSTGVSQTKKHVLQLPPGTSWQWQLSGNIDTSLDVDMYDIDLFNTPASVIKELHDKKRIVICYFSAGTWENWRQDKDKFPKQVMGKTMKDWKDEKWLDIRQIKLLAPIMQARLDLAVEKCCDGVEPDNVDGYINQTGFLLKYDDQIKYNKWLAEQAHARGLSIGLKNDLDQVEDLVDHFDWALNEQCFEFNECKKLLPFINRGKAVFGVEYKLKPKKFCKKANAMNFDWLYKDWDLTARRKSCR